MTRREQIEQWAKDYKCDEALKSGYAMSLDQIAEGIFIAGALKADANPNLLNPRVAQLAGECAGNIAGNRQNDINELCIKFAKEQTRAKRLELMLSIFNEAWLEHGCEKSVATCLLCRVNDKIEAIK